jgi:hypothetical protein
MFAGDAAISAATTLQTGVVAACGVAGENIQGQQAATSSLRATANFNQVLVGDVALNTSCSG